MVRYHRHRGQCEQRHEKSKHVPPGCSKGACEVKRWGWEELSKSCWGIQTSFPWETRKGGMVGLVCFGNPGPSTMFATKRVHNKDFCNQHMIHRKPEMPAGFPVWVLDNTICWGREARRSKNEKVISGQHPQRFRNLTSFFKKPPFCSMWGQLCSASPGVTWGSGGSTDWPQGIYMPPQISTELRVQSEFLLKRVHNLHQILKGAVTPERLGTQREKWQKWGRDDHLGEGGDLEHRERTSFLEPGGIHSQLCLRGVCVYTCWWRISPHRASKAPIRDFTFSALCST